MAGTLLVAAAGAGAVFFARASLLKPQPFEYKGKVALITGGSRGLGLELARQLAASGAMVAICGRDQESLEQARAELASNGAQVLAVRCDVTSKAEVEGMVQQILDRFGRIDVLINNAGIIVVGPREHMTDDDFRDALNLHFWAPYYTTTAVLPEMRRRRQGRIVNITSVGAKIAVPHLLPYSASKFAGYGYSRGLASEVRSDGVLVTTVVPGLMRTGSPRNADFKGQHRKEFAWFSIGDSLPGLSMSSTKAAESILKACLRGDVELTLTLPAKVAILADALFPGVSGEVAAIANRLLPSPGGIGDQSAKGRDSESSASPSFLTAASEQAAERNNQN